MRLQIRFLTNIFYSITICSYMHAKIHEQYDIPRKDKIHEKSHVKVEKSVGKHTFSIEKKMTVGELKADIVKHHHLDTNFTIEVKKCKKNHNVSEKECKKDNLADEEIITPNDEIWVYTKKNSES